MIYKRPQWVSLFIYLPILFYCSILSWMHIESKMSIRATQENSNKQRKNLTFDEQDVWPIV